ncbi:MAG: hypothetical protein JWQ61_2858 [Collimonas fungivorans]|nr:hypothetical protein [Collimonas fungivorans]
MAKKTNTPRPESETVAQQPERIWWKRMFGAATVAIVASTGGVLVEAYTGALTSFIKPTLAAGWKQMQDHLFPMPDDKLIAVSLQFFIPPNVNKERSAEGISATFWPARCKRPEGDSFKRPFDGGERDSYTNAIVNISCRASGRTLITLTPQSGTTHTLYDGILKDGEKLAFPGVPGSYYAGIVSLYLLDTKMPDGPWRPVNKCQINNSCAAELGANTQVQH